MINFPTVFLPPEFTHLLKLNLHKYTDYVDEIENYILEQKAFRAFITKLFIDIDPEKRVSRILQALSWKSFRDRVASSYIVHSSVGKYPENSGTVEAEDLVQFEKDMMPYTVEGISRSFLLALYLKMANIRLRQQRDQEIVISKDVMQLLSYMKLKQFRIDWLLIIVYHFEHFLGKDKFKKLLVNQGYNFKKFLSLLDQEKQELLLSNLLAYGASIHESDLFTEEVC